MTDIKTISEGKGFIFLNTEKKTEKSPDITGKMNIGGVIIEYVGWEHVDSNGNQYFTTDLKRKDNTYEVKPKGV